MEMDGDQLATTASLNGTRGFTGNAEITVWKVLTVNLRRIDDLLILCNGSYRTASDVFSSSASELDDDDKDPSYDMSTTSQSDSGSDSDTISDSSCTQMSTKENEIEQDQIGPHIPTYATSDSMDKRIGVFTSNWDKVQTCMGNILKIASQEYVVTRKGKLTSSNEAFGLMCLTAADDLKRKCEVLENSALKVLGTVEKKARTLNSSARNSDSTEVGTAPPPVFQRPVKRHLGMWICTVCNIGYVSKVSMEDCYRRHEDEKLVCSICEQAFSTENSLKNHLDSHVYGPYLCTECGKEFKTKSGLNRCIRKHSQPKGQYLCHICGKKYNAKEAFTDHVDGHSNARKYKCPRCNKRYKNNNTKRQHLHKVHTVKDLKCAKLH